MESRLLLAIVAGLLYWWGWNMIGYCWIDRFGWNPLIHAFVFGIVTGRMTECMIIGSALSIIYVSLVAAGGNAPEDSTASGAIAIPIALMNNLSTEEAVALGIAVAVLGNLLLPIQYNVLNFLPHIADKYAEKGDYNGIYRTNFLSIPLVGLVRFPAAFAAVYFGTGAIDTIMNILPEWAMHGLEISGGVLPAVGIATTLHIINKQKYLPIFLFGYFFVVVFDNLSILSASIFGICAIILYVVLSIDAEKDKVAVSDDED